MPIPITNPPSIFTYKQQISTCLDSKTYLQIMQKRAPQIKASGFLSGTSDGKVISFISVYFLMSHLKPVKYAKYSSDYQLSNFMSAIHECPDKSKHKKNLSAEGRKQRKQKNR